MTTAAQNERISLPATKMSPEQIVSEIERQTNFGFVFNGSVFDSQTEITFNSREVSVLTAIDKLVAGKNLEYFFRGNYIVINRKNNTSAPLAVKIAYNAEGYKRNSPNDIDGFYGSKGTRYEIRYDTIIKPGEVLPYPDPYSDYKPLRNHIGYPSKLPVIALKTNLLYTGVTFTPNLALEFGVGKRSTIEISGSYNWQGRTASASDNHKQRVHMIIRPEYRYWLCERFNGHYFGLNATYFKYNISGIKVPLMFEKDSRYDGNAFGAGVTYGYHWAFAKRWGLDFHVGAGYMYMDYDKFSCAKCDVDEVPKTKHYFGPTRAGISLVFMIR